MTGKESTNGRIVVGVDGSDHSKAALAVTLSSFTRRRATVDRAASGMGRRKVMPDPMAAAELGDRAGTATTPFDRSTLEPIIEVANRAPSIHNTQPWLWELHPSHLSLRADRDRQLRIADPDGHSLRVSCGAALALTELGFRTLGWDVEVRRLPEPSDPDLIAEFRVTQPRPATLREQQLFAAAQRRRSDRRPFRSHDVPPEAVETLRSVAAGPGVHADFPVREEQRINLAVAVSSADRTETKDPEYLAEMNRWLRESDVHADGVPAGAVPHVSEGHSRHTDVPLRDFEVGVSGRLLIENDADERPLIAVLLTDSDTVDEQLLAGESLMRLWLEAELLGLATCPLSQAVDLVAFRTRVRTLMGWQGVPQMMLRVGYPAASGPEPVRTPRRPLADVLHVLPS
jgi:nitroreductase